MIPYRWRNEPVIISTDNQVCNEHNNTGTSKNDIVVQAVRSMHLYPICMWYLAIHVYVPGYSNVIADAKSRLSDRRVLNKLIMYIHQVYTSDQKYVIITYFQDHDSCLFCLAELFRYLKEEEEVEDI